MNEDQQVVLEWLKEQWNAQKHMRVFPFDICGMLVREFADTSFLLDAGTVPRHVRAYGELLAVQQLEVLRVFAEWALEQEEQK